MGLNLGVFLKTGRCLRTCLYPVKSGGGQSDISEGCGSIHGGGKASPLRSASTTDQDDHGHHVGQ